MANNWECFCGNFVEDAFACDECGLTVVGSDMKKYPEADQMIEGMIGDIKNMDWSVKDEDEVS